MARFCNLWPASFDVLCIFIEEKKAIQLVNAGVIVQTVLLSFFFFSFYFLNAFQSDNNSSRVYVLGHKHSMFWGLLSLILSLA